MKLSKTLCSIGYAFLIILIIGMAFRCFLLSRTKGYLEETLLKSCAIIEEKESLILQLRCNPFHEVGDKLLIPPLCELPAITQHYGQNLMAYGGMNMKGHPGVDWACVEGEGIRASHNGEVFRVWSCADGYHGYGNHIKLRERFGTYNGYETVYAHLSKVFVEEGERVSQGQLIGYCGNTGKSTKAHLHFGIRFMNFPISSTDTKNPYEAVNGRNGFFGWVDPLAYLN